MSSCLQHFSSKITSRNALYNKLTFRFIGRNLLPFLVRANEEIFDFRLLRSLTYVILYIGTLYISVIFTSANMYYQEATIMHPRDLFKHITIWEIENPIHIFVTAPFYISLLSAILYIIYFLSFLLSDEQFSGKFKYYHGIISNFVPQMFLAFNLTNTGFAIIKWIQLDRPFSYIFFVFIVLFVIALPGIIISILYQVFVIRSDFQYSTITPYRYLVFYIGISVLVTAKAWVIMLNDEDSMTETIAFTIFILLFSYYLGVVSIQVPFTSSPIKRVLNAAICFSFGNGSILTIISYIVGTPTTYYYEVSALGFLVLDFLLISLVEKWRVSLAKKFANGEITLQDQKITPDNVLEFASYSKFCGQLHDEETLLETCIARWPDATDLHLYLLHIILTNDETSKQINPSILTMLEQKCISESISRVLHLLVVLEFASRKNQFDNSSIKKQHYVRLLESARENGALFWRLTLNDMPQSASAIFPHFYYKMKQVMDFYKNLKDNEKEDQFYRLIHISFTKNLSIQYEDIKDIVVDFEKDSTTQYEWFTMDNAHVDEDNPNLIHLKNNHMGRRYFNRNESFISKEELDKTEKVKKVSTFYLKPEGTMIFLCFFNCAVFSILTLGISLYYCNIIQSERLYNPSDVNSVYPFLNYFFWHIYTNTTNFYDPEWRNISEMCIEIENIARNRKIGNETIKNNLLTISKQMKFLYEKFFETQSVESLFQYTEYFDLSSSIYYFSYANLLEAENIVTQFREAAENCNRLISDSMTAFFYSIAIMALLNIVAGIGAHFKIKLLFHQPFLIMKQVVNGIYRSIKESPYPVVNRIQINEPGSLAMNLQIAIKYCFHLIIASVCVIIHFLIVTSTFTYIAQRHQDMVSVAEYQAMYVSVIYDIAALNTNDSYSPIFLPWVYYCYKNSLTLMGESPEGFINASIFEDNGFYEPDFFHFIEIHNWFVTIPNNISIHYKANVRTFIEVLTDIFSYYMEERYIIPNYLYANLVVGQVACENYARYIEETKEWNIIIFFIFFVLYIIIGLGIASYIIWSSSLVFVTRDMIKFYIRTIMVLPEDTPFFEDNKGAVLDHARVIQPPYRTLSDEVIQMLPVPFFTTDKNGIVKQFNLRAAAAFPDIIQIGADVNGVDFSHYVTNEGEEHYYHLEKISITKTNFDPLKVHFEGSIAYILLDLTKTHRLQVENEQMVRKVDQLKEQVFPQSVQKSNDTCLFIESLVIVSCVFEQDYEPTQEEIDRFLNYASECADQTLTFFSTSNFQNSISFCFSVYQLLTHEMQHFKDSVSFAKQILKANKHIKIGIAEAKKSYVIVNKSIHPGIIFLSIAPIISVSITKTAPNGSISIQSSIVNTVATSISEELSKFDIIAGNEIEFYQFDNLFIAEQFLFE